MNQREHVFEPSDVPSVPERLRETIQQFRVAWTQFLADSSEPSRRPCLASYFAGLTDQERAAIFDAMMQVELQSRRRLGEFPSVADYGVEFASWLPRIESLLTQRAVGASEEPDRTSPDGLALDGTASSTQSFIRPSSAAMLSDTGPLPMANRLLAPAAPDPVPASIGRYRIESRVGSGSFGTVYRALDPNLKRRVAIKVTHRHRIRQAEDIDQFRREAQILAQLDHPNIVPVYDADMLDDGRVYVVANAS